MDGFVEVSEKELQEVNGGDFFVSLFIAITVGAIVAGCSNSLNNNKINSDNGCNNGPCKP